MEHDYSKDLTFIFTGSATASPNLIQSAIDQYVFGTLDSRNARVIMPVDHIMTEGQKLFFKWAKANGLELTLIKFTNGNFPEPEAHADNVFTVSTMSEMMDATFGEIAQADIMNNNETAFISLYKDGSASDLAWVYYAKQFEWLTTLNLSSGLVDHFDGYESADDKIKREAAEKKTAELEQQEKEAAKVAKKTTAKKTTAPRKRAVSKPVVEEIKTPEIEPEKPVVEAPIEKGWGEHTHYFTWVDDNNGKEGMFCRHCGIAENDDNSEKPANYELSGEIVMNTPKLPVGLEPAKLVDPTPDVWQDVAAAAIPEDSLVVKKSDMADLAESIEDMGKSFTRTIATLTKILREG